MVELGILVSFSNRNIMSDTFYSRLDYVPYLCFFLHSSPLLLSVNNLNTLF
jgi:hypothetical protein